MMILHLRCCLASAAASVIYANAVGALATCLAHPSQLIPEGRWRKMKGSASIRLRNGDVRLAEVH